ncbi:kelch-like protein diablo [Asterias rubens]|uniref:kelch-like protein diablo n=1 Tax=Asterias rubens TaxID=7604 RepID=UPI001455A5D2|nr:kelch-like protein diablo [Asterias rubens]XP_033632335.1 kelch-like protein diablo [Asterias rubens]
MMDFDELDTSCNADFIVHRAHEHYSTQALRLMQELRQAHKLCDIRLQVGGQVIVGHRVVLAAFSRYFYAMFTGDMLEASQSEVVMKQVDARSVEMLVEYAYTGILEIHIDTVQSLLDTAAMLQLTDVQTACSEFLKRQLHPANCLGIRNFADAHTCTDLVEASGKFAERHFTEVANEEEFLQLPKPQLAELLQCEDLNVSSEEEVYNAIMRWVYHDKEERKNDIAELLQAIRMPLLSPRFLVDIVEAEDLIKQDIKCRDLLDEAKNYHMLPDRRTRMQQERIKPRRSTVGSIYCVGGMDSTGHSLSSVERYNLSNGRVSIEASMNSPRSGVGVAVLEGKLYSVGGYDGSQYMNTVECLDPSTRRWHRVASMLHVRRYHSVIALDRQLYAVGGYDSSTVLDSVETYDPRTNRWWRVGSLDTKRRHIGVAAMGNYLYAVGGSDGTSYLKSTEKYDPRLNQWIPVDSMHSRRGGVGVAALGGRLYAMGGYDGQSNLNTLERYYPEEDRWTFLAPMAQCRSGHGCVVVGDLMYAIGGHDGVQYLNTVEVFDTQLGEWHSQGPMGTCRAVAGVAVLNNIPCTNV